MVYSSPFPWCLIDKSGVIKDVNEYWRNILGAGKDIFTGSGFPELVLEQATEQATEHSFKIFKAMSKQGRDFRVVTALKSKLPDAVEGDQLQAAGGKSFVPLKTELLVVPLKVSWQCVWARTYRASSPNRLNPVFRHRLKSCSTWW